MNHQRDCRNDDSGHVYMVMNAAQVNSSEYETLQVSNTTVTPTEVIKEKGKYLKKARVWMIIIILLTVLAVFTVIALAVGVTHGSCAPYAIISVHKKVLRVR